MLIGELMARVITSNPRIRRIYLCDDEYRQVIRDADVLPIPDYMAERNRRVSLAGATVYRLSEIGRL